MIKIWRVETNIPCLVVHVNDMSSIDVKWPRAFVKPTELIQGDLVASQSKSLKEDARCKELHLSNELLDFENFLTACITLYLVFLIVVIRANHKL